MDFPDPFTEPATHGVYPLPKNNVVLLSCMDLRQIDELETFMARDNLVNRYDHLICAGAALGVCQMAHPHWGTTFFDHLDIALRLHQPHDVYIVEHRNCGAYREFGEGDFPNEVTHWDEERNAHRKWAFELRQRINQWYAGWYQVWYATLSEAEVKKVKEGKGKHPAELNVYCFLMDLRGNVELLEPPMAQKTASRRRHQSK